MRSAVIAMSLALCCATASAREAELTSSEPELERRTLAVSAELRCLVCQNQTIADSNAALAVDLRKQVRDMLRAGKSESEIVDYMTARYGDFVLYRPPVKGATALLWFGPAALLLAGLAALVFVLRRRSRMAPELFDAEDSMLTDDTRSTDPAKPRPSNP